MSAKTTYFCDGPCCGEKIGDLYGPLRINVVSDSEPQCNATLELCSTKCAIDWLYFNGGGVTRYEPGSIKDRACHVETRYRNSAGKIP
jgi:hypothetical protein